MARKGVSSDIDETISSIREKQLAIEEEIQELLKRRKEDVVLPVSIFSSKLGMLEAASIYLKDKEGMSFKEISALLKRDYKTIWTSYNKGRRKNEK